MNRFILAALVLLAAVLPLASPFAGEEVVMSRGNFGEDFAFIDRYLKSEVAKQLWSRAGGRCGPPHA